MGERAIRVEDLGKRYRIGARRGMPGSNTAEALRQLLASPRRASRPEGDDVVWALRHASFEVEQGEVLGVIGRNGAGKSTLLKLLAHITEPTEGRAELRGRVAALLEVGTGFHAELTGRENVFMNGALLGMRKHETERKFEEIVEFSGVARFIDTPVKRYSSGMYMRLAFAVAAHLEPDILVVDEVLAVGDLEFQKKCLGKMRDVTRSGRTVLLVSHNMSTIKGLARRAIHLDAGRLVADGEVNRVVDGYLRALEEIQGGDIPDSAERIGTGEARIRRVELLDRSGRPRSQLYYGEPLRVALTVEVLKPVSDAVVEVGVCGFDGTRATTSFSIDGGADPFPLQPGVHHVAVDLDVHLIPGQYAFDLGVHHAGPPWTMDYVARTLPFEVLNVGLQDGDRYPYDVVRGFVRPPARWTAPAPAQAPLARQG